MDRTGQGLRHFFSKCVNKLFHNTQPKVTLAKKYEIHAQGQKCQNGKVAIFLPNCHFGTFVPVHGFQIFFAKITFDWVLWKSYYTLLPKKCLRPCPGLSMYLSERINWIISSFPRWISKILFVFGSLDHFGSLGCRIGECPFRYVLVLFLGSVLLITQVRGHI